MNAVTTPVLDASVELGHTNHFYLVLAAKNSFPGTEIKVGVRSFIREGNALSLEACFLHRLYKITIVNL